jgi:hypothetical protein
MQLSQKAVIDQIDAVLQRCTDIKHKSRYSDDLSDLPEEASEAVALLFAAIGRLSPPGSSYVTNASQHERWVGKNVGVAVAPLLGILRALRADIASGYLQSVAELIRADIFADFIEMADYLLQQSYKDPSAVVVGSVLEEHLRKLCQKNSLLTVLGSGAPKKADSLNSELAAAGIYSKLDQKNVTAWLDLRNKAAHGNYSEYTKEQVAIMLQGIRDFLVRYSA